MALEDLLWSPPDRHQNDLNDATDVIFNLCSDDVSVIFVLEDEAELCTNTNIATQAVMTHRK